MDNYIRELITKEGIMPNIKEPTKEELFFSSVICPKCESTLGMRVSNNKDYAFHCCNCNEDFHVSECSSMLVNRIGRLGKDGPIYRITFPGTPFTQYEDIKRIVEILHDKYTPASLGCDQYNFSIADKYTFITFWWNKEPNDEMIQNLTDEVIKLWPILKT